MAHWIGEAWAAEEAENDDIDDSDSNDIFPICLSAGLPRLTKWPKMSLARLFKGCTPPPWPTQAEIDAEVEADAREALVDEEEDGQPDNGAIEMRNTYFNSLLYILLLFSSLRPSGGP